MIDGTAIKELCERFAEPLTIGEGVIACPKDWSLKDASAIVEPGPKAAALQVNTLTAVRDYLKANRDRLNLSEIVVHVVTPKLVKVLGPLDARSRVRETFIDATAIDATADFVGQFRAHEDFVIGLQTRFTDLDQRDAVLKVIGSIKNEKVNTSMDDGVSQVVTARAGVALVTDAAVPNPVLLAPYRTFREVVQPSSLFVLRVQGGKEGSLPGVALFEADGGSWRMTAIARLHDWLSDNLPESVSVLA